MRPIDLSKVEEAKDFERVTPGGYVCGITNVKDVPEQEYLLIEYDIAEGNLKNYYRQLNDAKGFWGGKFVKSYREKALPFFKGFITAVENSNSGYKWNYDETTLKRKLIGLVFGEEEYEAKDQNGVKTGEIKKRLYVANIHSADKIRSGDFTVPPLKKLAPSAASSAVVYPDFSATSAVPAVELVEVEDDDLPF